MKKRALSLLMAFVMAVSLLPTAVFAAEGTLSGSGTKDDPYLIADAADLAAFRDLVNGSTDTENHRDACAKLVTDIDLKGVEWKPIGGNDGYATSYYAGQFDGNGKTISNFKINAGYNYAGFFSYVKDNAYIHDLKISEASISSSKNNAGGIIGTIISGTVERCSFSGEIKGLNTNRGYAGGIAGYLGNTNKTSPQITNCANFGSISAGYAGGIAGYAKYAKAISDCYNTGSVKGSTRSGGIVGQNMNGTKITNCYNAGKIEGTSVGAIAGFAGVAISQCYWTQPAAGTGGGIGNINDDGKVDSIASVVDKLGDAFTTDASGNVILKWEASAPVEKNPRIVISGESALYMTNSGAQPRATLTVAYKDMDETPAVTWTADNACVTLETPDNATETNHTVIVHAVKPGTVKITAVAGEYTAEFTMSIVPCVTTVEIKNINQPGAVAVGQTVQAQVNILGGGEYDYDNYPALAYQWYQGTTSIQGATNRTYTISDAFEEWDKIGVTVTCAGKSIHSYMDQQQTVRSSDYGILYPVAYDETFTLPAEIKEDTRLELPAEHTKDGVEAGIAWSGFSGVIAQDGTVTRPAAGKTEVELTARFTYGAAYANRTFKITVWSQAALDAITDADELDEIVAGLGSFFKLTPRYGADENVIDMVERKLGNDRVGVSIRSVEATNATTDASNIAADGAITYFYTDPNTVPSQWFGTYSVTFALTYGSAEQDVIVPVTLTWDEARVKDAMREEILDKVALPGTVEANFDLPKVVDGKKWTIIEWTSSDRAIAISTEKQGTADTLFEPYVGVITCTPVDQTVTLTAAFHFQYVEDETPITLYKTFEVTVQADPNAADRAAFYQNALDAAMASHLTDAVTGERLTEDNGSYAVRNDIHFPTTRDMQIDGKYAPVVIRSSDAATVVPTDVGNAARVEVYRPLPGEAARTVELTIQILDRPSGEGRDYDAMPVLAEKTITVSVQPLMQEEIDAEIALMERAKANYWDGVRNGNSDPEDVMTDLHAFMEYTQAGEWIYSNAEMTGSGIVPVALDDWYDQQIWRLFRSSNADVVAHENLLVTRQEESKAVTVTSYLSSEVLGKYAEKYPQNADFQKLYKQPVTLTLVVTGTRYDQGDATAREEAAQRAHTNRSTLMVTFSLSGNGMGFTESGLRYAEGSTVYDVFSDLLAKHGYTCKRRGSYIAAITSDTGVTLEEFDEGKDSGWLYRVNGALVGQYMSSQSLKDGDRIEVYFTSDWTREPDAGGWNKPGKTETVTNPDGSITRTETKTDGTTVITTTRPDGGKVETTVSARGEVTASVSIPEASGSVRVEIPVNEPTNGMVAVIVCPDGTEELVRSSVVTETGVALRVSGDVRLRIIDNAKSFNDMEAHWAKNEVLFASSRELFNGVGGGAFGPNLPMTRGMVNTVLARLAGVDTNGGETWYARGTAWAVEHGVSDGTNPEGNVTREQLAAMLYRYAGSPAVAGELSFDDAQDVSVWARDAVKWCADNGILNGVGGNRCAPQVEAERAQVAAMLMRFLQKTV